ncbi:Scr1 family TA system antitoxin-like transcriptional regulator [Micromonospora sp. WMMA1363]|nr:Scr1 family TA system antitoxin-like transcriptional regulator [Micromonospora sp. WMMA1363]MDM4723168.1 Scr1 family TA system antitoxin-like transcriptional regulator [Micromonospora sp. WMMA1363]
MSLHSPGVPHHARHLRPAGTTTGLRHSLTGALYLDKPTEVAAYELAWRDVTSRALDEKASRTFITATMEAFTRG